MAGLVASHLLDAYSLSRKQPTPESQARNGLPRKLRSLGLSATVSTRSAFVLNDYVQLSFDNARLNAYA